MIDAIQEAYYLRAMNPSDNSTLISLAVELGLDHEPFSRDLVDAKTQQLLEAEFALRRRLGVSSFPSLVLAYGERHTSIAIDYRSYPPALEAIEAALRQGG